MGNPAVLTAGLTINWRLGLRWNFLSMSDYLKLKTSFEFLIGNYRGQGFWIFHYLTLNWARFASFRFLVFCVFSSGFRDAVSKVELKIDFFLRRAMHRTDIMCLDLVRAYACSKNSQKLIFSVCVCKLGSQHQWIRLDESFLYVLLDLPQPSPFVGKLFCCVHFWQPIQFYNFSRDREIERGRERERICNYVVCRVVMMSGKPRMAATKFPAIYTR